MPIGTTIGTINIVVHSSTGLLARASIGGRFVHRAQLDLHLILAAVTQGFPHGDMPIEVIGIRIPAHLFPHRPLCACEVGVEVMGWTHLDHIDLARLATPCPVIWRYPQGRSPNPHAIRDPHVEIHLLESPHVEFAFIHLCGEAACLTLALHDNGCWIATAHLTHVLLGWLGA